MKKAIGVDVRMCADGPRKALWGKNWALRPDEERRLGTEAVGWELRPKCRPGRAG